MVFVVPAIGTPGPAGPVGPVGPAGPAGSGFLVGAKLTTVAGVAIAAAGTTIAWDTELFDPNGFHAALSTDLVIPAGSGAGKYAIWAQCSLALGLGTPYNISTIIRVNGGVRGFEQFAANTINSESWTWSTELDLAIGDVVQLNIGHTSTTDPINTSGGESGLAFAIQRVG